MEDKAWSKFFETQLKAKNKKDSSKYYFQQGLSKLNKDLKNIKNSYLIIIGMKNNNKTRNVIAIC